MSKSFKKFRNEQYQRINYLDAESLREAQRQALKRLHMTEEDYERQLEAYLRLKGELE